MIFISTQNEASGSRLQIISFGEFGQIWRGWSAHEATSALDYESEAAIMANMPEIIKDRTVISIAHRLNTLKLCDRVITMD